MKNNLKTVTLENNDFKFLEGWFASIQNNTLHVQLFNPIPVENINTRTTSEKITYLLSGSISRKYIERKFLPPEDSDSDKEETAIETILLLHPESDGNFYYKFILDNRDDISFSTDFDVLLDELIENPYLSEQYIRVVFAKLPKDVPLILDSEKVVCISPFNV